jgi:hypothetical protein
MKSAAFVLCMALMTGAFLCAQDAYIRECRGTVELKAPGSAVWITARGGEQIGEDTIVSTGFKSTAVIALGNSTLTVRPLTRLSLEEIRSAQGDETIRLNLHTGRVRADVAPPTGGKTDFAVRSPIATASVRGTAFDFDGMNLSVRQGRVFVSGRDGTGVFVGTGHDSVSNPKTGRTSAQGEMVKAGLTPPLPRRLR